MKGILTNLKLQIVRINKQDGGFEYTHGGIVRSFIGDMKKNAIPADIPTAVWSESHVDLAW